MKRQELQNNLAMTMVLISGSMLFATLLMGYSLYRSSAKMWPPDGVSSISLGYPLISTLVILISSWFSHQVRAEVKRDNFKVARMNLDTTIVLGLMFVITQTLLWWQMKDSGIYVSSGIFASIIYGFTWIHAAHMAMGLCSLVWLRLNLHPGTMNLSQKALNVEKFWHFLGIIWLVLFLTLFVI